jgi:xanthine/CO dehydrogenase XdhC/CoxF family maturation factor
VSLDVLREAIRLAEHGERIGLATIVATRGSTPQKVGARLLARDGQRLAGTLGGGAVEAETVREATLAATGEAPVLREYVLSTGVDDWGLAYWWNRSTAAPSGGSGPRSRPRRAVSRSRS